eukprot:SAG31_NODE_1545_length_7942_cov_6.001020_2_plen_56_part_00
MSIDGVVLQKAELTSSQNKLKELGQEHERRIDLAVCLFSLQILRQRDSDPLVPAA